MTALVITPEYPNPLDSKTNPHYISGVVSHHTRKVKQSITGLDRPIEF
jgi:hypothetical protein